LTVPVDGEHSAGIVEDDVDRRSEARVFGWDPDGRTVGVELVAIARLLAGAEHMDDIARRRYMGLGSKMIAAPEQKQRN
jgi:hypothetical protein